MLWQWPFATPKIADPFPRQLDNLVKAHATIGQVLRRKSGPSKKERLGRSFSHHNIGQQLYDESEGWDDSGVSYTAVVAFDAEEKAERVVGKETPSTRSASEEFVQPATMHDTSLSSSSSSYLAPGSRKDRPLPVIPSAKLAAILAITPTNKAATYDAESEIIVPSKASKLVRRASISHYGVYIPHNEFSPRSSGTQPTHTYPTTPQNHAWHEKATSAYEEAIKPQSHAAPPRCPHTTTPYRTIPLPPQYDHTFWSEDPSFLGKATMQRILQPRRLRKGMKKRWQRFLHTLPRPPTTTTSLVGKSL